VVARHHRKVLLRAMIAASPLVVGATQRSQYARCVCCRRSCGDNRTPPDFELSRELWTGRRSATSRQWSGTQACHKHHGNQRDGSIGQNLGWKLCVKEKWVKQELRTFDPEWRVSAGRVQKGNHGSRRPYIRRQSAGSWISRSRGVKPSRSVKIPM